ncbi:aspartate/tyrosine/aromatic aminotransferase [Halopseudomonas nanhaiensis]|uniref:amino acid aminotransferase n=1 Tax=Halopseudomonas nanhaiensis TaxID=2830842 RepID=UPI001CC133EB|nr:amino acid aminotransferase [Halopseudomonas nanhaiensis]UAW99791.1 aspartate/tyrosine/aromatic aminotransferase [Halopseudomonas nanhaiensis]
MSLFFPVEMAPHDPILGLNETYNADLRAEKVNLGVGVYYDEAGKVPLLRAVQAAEEARVAEHAPRSYLPIEGLAPYDLAVQKLLFGTESSIVESGRLITAQSLGGTGALKLGADFLFRLTGKKLVAISDPSWENHRALFEAAGYEVVTYPYYDAATNGLNLSGMLEGIEALPEGSVVLLHACCHNPTGVDLGLADWARVIDVIQRKNHVPFLDIAYQGFGENLQDDALAVRLFAETGMPFLVASSFSKSFSLYGERVGALTLVTSTPDERDRVLSQLKRVIRTNYSNPPTHGAKVVAAVLNNPELYAMWEEELAEMRERIRGMRQALAEKLKDAGVTQNVDYIQRQRGMFSYSGLNKDQVKRLADEFAIYAVSSGRICVAALNSGNIDHVAKAMAAVMKEA